jgi:hypothetical protein
VKRCRTKRASGLSRLSVEGGIKVCRDNLMMSDYAREIIGYLETVMSSVR